MSSSTVSPTNSRSNNETGTRRYDGVATSTVYFYDFPDTLQTPTVTRTFRFERNNGQWAVNGKFATCDDIRFAIKRKTAEKWIFQNNSGGWQHPIHMHFEEFQTLRINERAPRTSGIIEAVYVSLVLNSTT